MMKTLLVLAALCAVGLSQTTECNRTLDLVFVVDGSNSQGPYNFNLTKAAVRGAVEQLDVAPGQVRVGVVTYESGLGQQVPLMDDKNELFRAIALLQFPDGGTQTDKGLDWARQQLASKRRNAPQAIVVLTDGVSDDRALTLAAASRAKANGVQIFAVGVGPYIDEDELRAMAGPSHVFLVAQFTDLNEKLKNVTKVACATATTATPAPTTTTTTTTTTPPPTTTTPTTTTTPPTTTEAPTARSDDDACENATHVQGVGLASTNADCTSFVQCYFRPDLTQFGVPRKCPWGQFWHQERLKCQDSCLVDCKTDPCKTKPGCDATWAMQDGGCRAYWACVDGRSHGRCCPSGQRYVQDKGCVVDLTCQEPCGKQDCHVSPVCDLRPSLRAIANDKAYDIMVPALGWTQSECTSGVFNITACGCN